MPTSRIRVGQNEYGVLRPLEHEGGYLGDPGGVNRREREDEPCRRGGGRGDRALDLPGAHITRVPAEAGRADRRRRVVQVE